MNVAGLFSGGKDSVYALYIAEQYGWAVSHLITLVPTNPESWMFHAVNIHLTEQLAHALNKPLITKKTPGEKETELGDLKEILQHLDIDGVISGAIASEYQRTRIERVCSELGLKSFTPLWHKDPEMLLEQQVKAGFKIMIVGVFADGFDKSWLGRIIDENTMSALSQLCHTYNIHQLGEGGEFETLVLDGPILNKALHIEKIVKTWKRDHGVAKVEQARLVDK